MDLETRCPKCGYGIAYDIVAKRLYCAGRCGLEIYRNITTCTKSEPGSNSRYLQSKKYMDNYRLTHKRVRQEDGTYKWQKISTTAPAV